MNPRTRMKQWGLLALIHSIATTLMIFVLAGCNTGRAPIQRPIDGNKLSLKWTYETGSPINQVPAKAIDVVVVVPAGGPLTALDAHSGTLRWQYDPPGQVWERSYAVDGNDIYVGVEGGRLIALDAAEGENQWEKNLGIEVQIPPLVTETRLYVPTTYVGPGIKTQQERRAKLYILDRDSGEEIWSFETDNYILQTPEIHGDSLYLAGNFLSEEAVDEGGHTRLYRLDLNERTVRWTYESEDGFPKRLFATDSVVTFIGYQDFVSGVDVTTGNLRWRRDTGNWVPSLVGEGETVYFGSANTIIHAIDVSSGDIRWQYNIEHGTFNYVLGAPIFIDDALYFLTQHGDLAAVNALDGTLIWEYSTGITSRVGLSAAAGWMYIGDENGVVWAYSDT